MVEGASLVWLRTPRHIRRVFGDVRRRTCMCRGLRSDFFELARMIAEYFHLAHWPMALIMMLASGCVLFAVASFWRSNGVCTPCETVVAFGSKDSAACPSLTSRVSHKTRIPFAERGKQHVRRWFNIAPSVASSAKARHLAPGWLYKLSSCMD